MEIATEEELGWRTCGVVCCERREKVPTEGVYFFS